MELEARIAELRRGFKRVDAPVALLEATLPTGMEPLLAYVSPDSESAVVMFKSDEEAQAAFNAVWSAFPASASPVDYDWSILSPAEGPLGTQGYIACKLKPPAPIPEAPEAEAVEPTTPEQE